MKLLSFFLLMFIAGLSPAGAAYNGIPPEARAYGADQTGVSDSTTAIQSCLTAASATAQRVCNVINGRFKVLGNLTIPARVTLSCGQTFNDFSDFNVAGFGTAPALMLDSARTISASGGNAKIDGCLIYRNGMTFPAANSSAYAGLAISDAGTANFTLTNSVIVGFDSCALIAGLRPEFRRVWCDSIGVTHAAIDIENGNTDAGHFDEIKLQPLGTGNYNGTTVLCAAATRSGTGFKMAGINFMGKIVAQNYRVAQFTSTADFVADTVWVDFPSACLGTYTPTGINLTGPAHITHVDLNSLTRGMLVNLGAASSSVDVSNLFCNTIGQDCIELAAGYLHINDIRTNDFGGTNVGRYLVNYTDGTGGATLAIDGGVVGKVNGSVAPYINVANTIQFFRMLIGDGITTDLANNAGFYGATPTIGACTGLGTGSCALGVSSRSTPWKGQAVLTTSGAPAAAGVAQVTFPMQMGTTGACQATLQDGANAWPATSTVRVSGISGTVQQLFWNTNGAALANAANAYRINFSCAPE